MKYVRILCDVSMAFTKKIWNPYNHRPMIQSDVLWPFVCTWDTLYASVALECIFVSSTQRRAFCERHSTRGSPYSAVGLLRFSRKSKSAREPSTWTWIREIYCSHLRATNYSFAINVVAKEHVDLRNFTTQHVFFYRFAP